MNEELEAPMIPKAPRPKRGNGNLDTKQIGIEIAALAYVAMENDSYTYAQKNMKPVPPNKINKKELLRLAGYSPTVGTYDFEKTLGKKAEFWQLIELYRIRRADPMFRKEQQKILIGEIANKLSLELYEAIFYYPHSISFKDKLTALKTIVDLGYRVNEPKPESGRTDALLAKLKPEARQEALAGIEENLRDQLSEVSALKSAHLAADAEES